MYHAIIYTYELENHVVGGSSDPPSRRCTFEGYLAIFKNIVKRGIVWPLGVAIFSTSRFHKIVQLHI